jgi:DNA primase large subunit
MIIEGKLIESLLAVIDRLKQIPQYRNARLNKRFNEIFKPAFQDLEAIHFNHIAIFEKVFSMFPTEIDDDIVAELYGKYIREAIAYLREQRRIFQPVRDKLALLTSS